MAWYLRRPIHFQSYKPSKGRALSSTILRKNMLIYLRGLISRLSYTTEHVHVVEIYNRQEDARQGYELSY